MIAPLDCWPAVTRFLDAAKPYSLILVETELWPNMIAAASRRGLKIGLVNGRLSERSFSRYLLARPLLAPFLRKVCRLAVQGEADGERFRALGAPEGSVLVVGNMKYDRVKVPDTAAAAQRLRSLGWAGAPVFVAGSTHPGEEEAVLGAFLSAQARHPALKLVIAPRPPERAADTAASLKNRGVTFTSWSARESAPASDCLLIDRLGPLASFYPSATVSFVGGTLVPVGGHNIRARAGRFACPLRASHGPYAPPRSCWPAPAAATSSPIRRSWRPGSMMPYPLRNAPGHRESRRAGWRGACKGPPNGRWPIWRR